MKKLALAMTALLGLGAIPVVAATEMDAMERNLAYYMGCLDGAASAPIDAQVPIDKALDEAERRCSAQFKLVRGIIDQQFKSGFSSSEYSTYKDEIHARAEIVAMQAKTQAKSSVRELIEERRVSQRAIDVAQEAVDAAIKATEQAEAGNE